MTWRDALTLAARNVGRRPGRAVLTVIAVALAAALFSALLTIAGTARTRVLGELAKGGPLAGIKVVAAAADPGQLDSDSARPGEGKAIDDSAVDRISRLRGVRSVVPVLTADVRIAGNELVLADGQVLERQGVDERERSRGTTGETLIGVDITQAVSLPITVISGRLPGPGTSDEIAVSPDWVRAFGLDRKQSGAVVGAEIEYGAPFAYRDGERFRFRGRWTRAVIVGVVAQEAGTGAILAPIEAVEAAKAWTARSAADFDPGPPQSPYAGLFVVADGLDRVGTVRASITDVGYATSAPENLIASVQRYLRVVEIVLTGIGFIALMIASLGIANALLAAVRERRREIGVLKAIGARDRDVVRIFLIEAAVLGAVGGIVGTAIGVVIARIVGAVVNGYLTSQGLVGVRAGASTTVLVGGVLGSVGLAVVAGAVPAFRAARLPAREAVDG